MSLPTHGSNPHYLYKTLSMKQPNLITDFSVNLNPLGMLPSIQSNWNHWIKDVEDYPDPNAMRLINHIANYTGLKEEYILIGNGGSQLISLIAQTLHHKRVGIVQPTFVQYEQACRLYECEIEQIILKENNWQINFNEIKESVKRIDALFICNPNNPTGVQYSKKDLKHLLYICKKENCLLIIDEAFYDFCIKSSTLQDLVPSFSNLIIIRSLTKMYNIAGLRLGYLFASPSIITELRKYQPSWSVSAIALRAGLHCFQAKNYVTRTRTYITEERRRIFSKLKEHYFLSNSSTNFYLLRDPHLENQHSLMVYLLQKGIVPRHTNNFLSLDGRWLRFAIKTKEENDRLITTLLEWPRKSL